VYSGSRYEEAVENGVLQGYHGYNYLQNVWQILLNDKNNTAMTREVRVNGMEQVSGRDGHATIVDKRSELEATIYFIGGNISYSHPNYNPSVDGSNGVYKLHMLLAKKWWLLHYLRACNMIYLIGYNECKDAYDMYMNDDPFKY
jgi:hypothetical protein